MEFTLVERKELNLFRQYFFSILIAILFAIFFLFFDGLHQLATFPVIQTVGVIGLFLFFIIKSFENRKKNYWELGKVIFKEDEILIKFEKTTISYPLKDHYITIYYDGVRHLGYDKNLFSDDRIDAEGFNKVKIGEEETITFLLESWEQHGYLIHKLKQWYNKGYKVDEFTKELEVRLIFLDKEFEWSTLTKIKENNQA